jgi:hypothetical protein
MATAHQVATKKPSGAAERSQVVVSNLKETAKSPEEALAKKVNNRQFIKERPRLVPATIEKVQPEKQDQPPSQRKYPQRGPRVDYTEMDDDHFLCE